MTEASVLHLIGSLVGGGAEKQLGLLAPALLRAGTRVHVAYLHPGVNLPRLEVVGPGLHRIPSMGNHDPLILWRLCRLIRRLQPDVLQTWLTQMDVLGGIAAKLTGIPHILSERNSKAMYGPSWKNGVRYRVGRHAAAIVANSEAGLRYWTACRENPMDRVIRNGVALDEVRRGSAADPTSLGFATGTDLVLFAGRLSPEKNPALLVRALQSVTAANSKVAAVVFGDGPLRGELEQLIRRCGIVDRVRLPGYTTELGSWMRAAKVLVSTSVAEGHPNVVLEAMASNVPLVVSDIPGHREILTTDMARFFHPDSVESLAGAINDVLAEPERARSRALAASERVGSWSIEAAAGEYTDLYRRVAARRHSRSQHTG